MTFDFGNRFNILILSLLALVPLSQAQAQSVPPRFNRQAAYQQLTVVNQERKMAAEQVARQRGLNIRLDAPTANKELMAFHAATPIYFTTMNANARISSGAGAIGRGTLLNLKGTDLIAGVWDGSTVKSGHIEFGGRVRIKDDGMPANHSTHVAGTIAASGSASAAMGMAMEASVYSFNWLNDTAEILGYGADASMQANRIYVSNHSYGRVAGWSLGAYTTPSNQYHWFGKPGEREDYAFGQYDKMSAEWDQACYDTAYLLPFFAAGNDRSDTSPFENLTFYYAETGTSESFRAETGPYADGYDNGGYDTIPTFACAKNVMTVGSVQDAVANGARDLSKAQMTLYSAWGPPDDGRVKPDIVANGDSVYSCDAWTNNHYTSMSGTSMAAPNASGTALLLVDYVARMIGGQALRASTLKALVIHTADDLGTPGPDYRFGWGLINGLAAAQVIRDFAENPSRQSIMESDLFTTRTTQTFHFRADGAAPIRATLCWTDPAGVPVEGLDNRQPVLVNDLDLRIDGPGGKRYLPFVLNPDDPSAPASQGNNHVDNVEQVLISAPQSGSYTLTIERKGAFAHQAYSVVLTGSLPDSLVITPVLPFEVKGPEGGPLTLPENNAFALYNSSNFTVKWKASTDCPWLRLGLEEGTIAPMKTVWLPVSIIGSLDTLKPGSYAGLIHIENISTGVSQNRGVAVLVRPVSGFRWSPIRDQRTDQAFDVQLTARDSAGSTVTAYTGSVEIQGLLPDGGQSVSGLGDNATSSVLATSVRAGKIQCLYRFDQIETTGTIFALSLDVHAIPAGPIDQFKIRMKHTAKASFGSADWEEGDGWRTVYNSNLVVSKLAWKRISLERNFWYNGHDNLIVEFSFRNANVSEDGLSRTTAPGGLRTISHYEMENDSDPLGWNNALGPHPILGGDLPDLKFELGIPVYPSETGPFVKGVWKGQLRLGHGATGMFLYASDEDHYDGESEVFNVLQIPKQAEIKPEGWALYH